MVKIISTKPRCPVCKETRGVYKKTGPHSVGMFFVQVFSWSLITEKDRYHCPNCDTTWEED